MTLAAVTFAGIVAIIAEHEVTLRAGNAFIIIGDSFALMAQYVGVSINGDENFVKVSHIIDGDDSQIADGVFPANFLKLFILEIHCRQVTDIEIIGPVECFPCRCQ